MVIVCEDSEVTPSYLRGFANELKAWDAIDIFPLPAEEAGTTTNAVEHKSGRKLRKLHAVSTPLSLDIEKEYKAVPTRYVREAQKRMEEAGHNEAWAVYDKDGHPHHENSYLLAQQHPRVNIAFNSIAIEQWFLLHFEINHVAYQKSAHIPLATHIAEYVIEKKAKTKIYDHLKLRLPVALNNVVALRLRQNDPKIRFYEKNPYANMDHLLLRMHGYGLMFPGDSFIIQGITFSILMKDEVCEVHVLNNAKAALISTQIQFYIIASNGAKNNNAKEREIVSPGATKEFSFEVKAYPLFYMEFANEVIVIDTTCNEPRIIAC